MDLPIDFIKIDVEGAEFHVVRGGIQTILRSKPIIVFEHGLGCRSSYGIGSDDIYDLLTDECGLRLSLMKRWLAGDAPLSRNEFITEATQRGSFYFIAYP